MDNQEIYKLLFGEKLAPDEARKRLYGVRAYLAQAQSECVDSIQTLSEFQKLEEKKQELQKIKYQISTLRNDLTKQIRDESRRELVLEEILKAIPQAPLVDFKPLQRQDNKKGYLLSVSDIHYSSFFKSINNEYSIEIVKERFNKLLYETIQFIEKEKVQKLYISNTGDSLQGIIRVSDLKKNQVGLLQSVVDFSRFMADFLNKLSEYVEIEYYHVPTANHSELRLFDKERKSSDENLEYIIIHYIHDYLKFNKRIKVVLPSDVSDCLEFELCGFNFILLHGHQIKSQKNLLMNLSMRNKKFYDYVVLGHFHTSTELSVGASEFADRELLIVPSIVGSDSYSDRLMLDTKSAAKMFIFEEKRGKIQSNTFVLN